MIQPYIFILLPQKKTAHILPATLLTIVPLLFIDLCGFFR